MLELMRVQEVRRDKGGTEPAGNSVFFYVNGNNDHKLWTGDFVRKEIMSAFKSEAFVSES